MGKAIKALLLSALVLPGAGHIYLKKYSTGIAIIAIALISLTVVLTISTQQALTVVDQLQAQGGIVSLDQVTALATKAETQGNNQLKNIAMYILIASWVVGMVDALRLGAKKSAG